MTAERKTELGYVIVSNLVAQERTRVGFLYRETPDNNLDSGWRIFSGSEDEDYIEDPDNFGIYDPKKIVKIDPTIEPLLASPYKTAFERTGTHETFVEVYDFEFVEEDDEEE